MGSFIAALLLQAILFAPARAETGKNCGPDFAALTRGPQATGKMSFWERAEPVTVTRKGKTGAFTFSFDSEIPHDQIYRALWKDPEAMQELERAAHKLQREDGTHIFDPFARSGLRLPEIAAVLGMSEKKAKAFALRKGAFQEGRENYLLSDLTPSAFETFVRGYLNPLTISAQQIPSFPQALSPTESSAKAFWESYRTLAMKFAPEKHLPFDSHREQSLIEITHRSWELSPAVYHRQVMGDLHGRFPRAQTHVHVGAPAAQITENSANTGARAVESRIILRLAANSPDGSQPLYATNYNLVTGTKNYFSTLRMGQHQSGRQVGVVRQNFFKFTSPALAHDFEIRQWLHPQEAFDDAELYVRVTQAAETENAQIPKSFSASYVPDFATSNLNGALKYTGLLFLMKADEESREIGRRLVAFAEKIEREQKITGTTRKEVYQYLNDHEVIEKLGSSLYIRAENGTP